MQKQVTLTHTAARMLLEVGSMMHEHLDPKFLAVMTSDTAVTSFALITVRLMLIGLDLPTAVKVAGAYVMAEAASTTAATTGKDSE